MNSELLHKIAYVIENNPWGYTQLDFAITSQAPVKLVDDRICNTAHCIAGWACVIEDLVKPYPHNSWLWVRNDPTNRGFSWEHLGAEALDIDDDEIAHHLFHEDWAQGKSPFEVASLLRRAADTGNFDVIHEFCPDWRHD